MELIDKVTTICSLTDDDPATAEATSTSIPKSCRITNYHLEFLSIEHLDFSSHHTRSVQISCDNKVLSSSILHNSLQPHPTTFRTSTRVIAQQSSCSPIF